MSEQSLLRPPDYIMSVDYTISQALDLLGRIIRF
jgi:hypothetical protein